MEQVTKPEEEGGSIPVTQVKTAGPGAVPHGRTLKHAACPGADVIEPSYDLREAAKTSHDGHGEMAVTHEEVVATLAVRVKWEQELASVESEAHLGAWISMAYKGMRRSYQVIWKNGSEHVLRFSFTQTELRADVALHFQSYAKTAREDGLLWPTESGSGSAWVPLLLDKGEADVSLTLAWDRLRHTKDAEVKGNVHLTLDREQSRGLEALAFEPSKEHDLTPARVAHARQAAYRSVSGFIALIDRKTLKANGIQLPYTSPELDRIFAPYSPGMCPPVPMMPSYIFYRYQREEATALVSTFLLRVVESGLARSGISLAQWTRCVSDLLDRGVNHGEFTRLCLAAVCEAAQLVALELPYVGDYMVHRGTGRLGGFLGRGKDLVTGTDLYSDALRLLKRVKDCEDAARVILRILMCMRRYHGDTPELRLACRLMRAYVLFGFNGAVFTGRADTASRDGSREIAHVSDPDDVSSHGAALLIDPRHLLGILRRTYPSIRQLPRGLHRAEDAPQNLKALLPMQVVEGTGLVGTIPLSPVWYDGLGGKAEVKKRERAFRNLIGSGPNASVVRNVLGTMTARVENNDYADTEEGRQHMREMYPNFFHRCVMHLFAAHDEDTPDEDFLFRPPQAVDEPARAEIEASANSCMAMHALVTHAEGTRSDGARATFGCPITYLATQDERATLVMTAAPHPDDSRRMRMAYQHLAPPPLLQSISSPKGLVYVSGVEENMKAALRPLLHVQRATKGQATHYMSFVWKSNAPQPNAESLGIFAKILAANEHVAEAHFRLDDYVEGHVNCVLGIRVLLK